MIMAIIVILLTWLFTSLIDYFSITTGFYPTAATIIILIISLSIIFWITHLIISKDKSFRKYDKMWDEPEIVVSGIGYSILVALLMLLMTFNIKNGKSFLNETIVFWILLIIFDIVNVRIVFKAYSFELVESIKDSILLQIRRVQNGLLISLAVFTVIKFTIVGGIVIAIFFAIIWSLIFGSKKK